MKKFTFILATIIFMSGIISCNTTQKQIKQVKAEKIDSTYNVKVGEVVTLKFSSNPSTGYRWKLSGKSNDRCLKLDNHEYKADSNNSQLVGSGGTEYWTFNAKKTGELILLFKYERNENDVAKERYYKIIISE